MSCVERARGSAGPEAKSSTPSPVLESCPPPGTYLVQHHPVGIDLRVPFRVQDHRLVGSEVSQGDLCILRADVDPINDLVLVKVGLTDVSHAVP